MIMKMQLNDLRDTLFLTHAPVKKKRKKKKKNEQKQIDDLSSSISTFWLGIISRHEIKNHLILDDLSSHTCTSTQPNPRPSACNARAVEGPLE